VEALLSCKLTKSADHNLQQEAKQCHKESHESLSLDAMRLNETGQTLEQSVEESWPMASVKCLSCSLLLDVLAAASLCSDLAGLDLSFDGVTTARDCWSFTARN